MSYATQGYCPECDASGESYAGRFFNVCGNPDQLNVAKAEWERRSRSDLKDFWTKSQIPFGHMTHQRQPLPQHGFTHWWKMFGAKQLLAHTLLLREISAASRSEEAKFFVLGAFQQYLRNQNLFCFWDISRDCMAPLLSNANFHPKNNFVENCVYAKLGRGNWESQHGIVCSALDWKEHPWELVYNKRLSQQTPLLAKYLLGTSEKVLCGDHVFDGEISAGSSTELGNIYSGTYDLVVTDPPFGGLLHYSELSDFFYVWLRLPLKQRYPESFSADYTPKTLEAVANRARQPGVDDETGRENADVFYQRLLRECWKEAYRLLKSGGVLTFTFHHSEDAPWVSVLESLFDAGFYLVATYPIRSDETKGTGQFGSKQIEYDIIHVCRKRHQAPKPVSWAKLRRQVLSDVRALQELLEHHQNEGLPEADLQVIRRGKALEYFSRHYGKVYKDQDTPMTVLEALLGINQLLDEEAGGIKEAPPHNAEPFTRMLLRLFDGRDQLPRDQMQKFLRGTGSAPSDFSDRGWVCEEKKVFYLTPPLDLARSWIGKHRKGMQSDYDQAMFLVGACFEGSGINVSDTLSNPNFRPHPALAPS
jgi:putative DNA methylase